MSLWLSFSSHWPKEPNAGEVPPGGTVDRDIKAMTSKQDGARVDKAQAVKRIV